MKTLFIDATVRSGSRTLMLAEHLLSRLGGKIERVRLCELDLPKADEAYLAERDRGCASGDLSGEMYALPRQFAEADEIVIAAPFWDLSFPASLKQYFELINVIGLTFAYSEEGAPYGLCRAKRLFYVTTAGGRIFSEEYGFGYVKALAERFYQIPDCRIIKAEGLDILGADVKSILAEAIKEIDKIS